VDLASLRESSRLTAGHRGELFLSVLLAIALNILGLFALVIGVLITSASR
jgi:hypothetical protein